MRTRLLALALPALTLAPLGVARAGVTEANFQMRTAADLVTLCAAAPDDPLATAAVNFCHGFAVSVYQTLSEEQAATRQKFFCASQPPPSRNQAIASFVSWARANPSAMSERPADAIADYLTTRFPCPGR
jgi:Ssp1 endopeptidase immunity protein Rap1a